MTADVDTWLVAALDPDDRVLLLGAGWDAVARALASQGVAVTVDRPLDEADRAPGIAVLADGDDPGGFPVVGVALDGAAARDLERALAAEPDRLVTRLSATTVGDLGGLARPWPVVARSEAVLQRDWVGRWDRVDEPSHDLATRLVTMLHTTTQGLEAIAEAATESRDDATRAASTWRRREAAATARAQATTALANRWSDTRDAMLDSLLHAEADVTTVTDGAETAPAGVAASLRSLLTRGSPDPAPATPAGTPRSRSAPGWRVACVEGPAADWLTGWVDATVVPADPAAPAELVEQAGGHLDVLVVGSVEPARRGVVGSLAATAREAGAVVVGVGRGGMPWPGFPDLCDVLVTDQPDLAGPRTLALPPPVDPAHLNPTVGFRFRATGLATVLTGTGHDLAEVRTAARQLGVPDDDLELVGPGGDRGLPADPVDRARLLRSRRGLVDVPAAHTSHAEHARTLAALAAAGVPVSSPMLPDAVADLLGPSLARELRTVHPDQLDDVHVRERHSVRQRRAALWAHTTEARWRRLGHVLDLVVPPRTPVSAVVVTNRPGHLAHCAEQLARQTYRPLEVVVGLHGDRFTAADVDAFVARVPVDVTVVPVDGHRTLGEGLNLACRAASGTILAKWDDDDHYGPDHLVDLVQALDYSGATIVGKGSEFVHLGQLDVTIRRFVGKAESGSRSLAGGTLALHREDLATAGWWRRVPRAVDQKLLDDVQRAGGRVHRTHGYGFVLARRANGHTWSVDVDYFLAQSEAQWRGLAREAAGLDDRVVPLPPDLSRRADTPVAPDVVDAGP